MRLWTDRNVDADWLSGRVGGRMRRWTDENPSEISALTHGLVGVLRCLLVGALALARHVARGKVVEVNVVRGVWAAVCRVVYLLLLSFHHHTPHVPQAILIADAG